MKIHSVIPAAGICASALSLASIVPARCAVEPPATAESSAQQARTPVQSSEEAAGLHDFDFFIGEWRVHHRQLKQRLAGSHEWVEFEGTTRVQKIMGGWGNMDDNTLDKPGGAYRAVTLRAFDANTGQWSIWWLDGRHPASNLDPSVKGHFDQGVGTFYADDTWNGKPIRVRFTWSHPTTAACRWEQAFSPDGGRTWETNWIMEFRRLAQGEASLPVSDAGARRVREPNPLI
jgi:hypothetical protein